MSNIDTKLLFDHHITSCRFAGHREALRCAAEGSVEDVLLYYTLLYTI